MDEAMAAGTDTSTGGRVSCDIAPRVRGSSAAPPRRTYPCPCRSYLQNDFGGNGCCMGARKCGATYGAERLSEAASSDLRSMKCPEG